MKLEFTNKSGAYIARKPQQQFVATNICSKPSIISNPYTEITGDGCCKNNCL